MGNNPLSWVDSSGLVTTVIYTSDGIDHVAVHVDNPNGEPLLYDPNGSYRIYTKSTYDKNVQALTNPGPFFEGKEADLDSYVAHLKKYGPNVELFQFNTTAEDEADIIKNIEALPTPGALSCSIQTSSAISGVGPFKNIKPTPFPWSLADQLRALKGKK